MKAIPPHLSQTPEEAYRKMKYAGTHVATRDPKRPEYHFHSAGQWMDDPNGSVYHNGYYHIMYGANPDSDSNRGGMPYKTASNKWSPDEPDWMDGIDVWGHARSRDLIHWEHLPISVFRIQKGRILHLVGLHQNKRRRHPHNNIYKRGPRAEPDRLRRAVHRLR